METKEMRLQRDLTKELRMQSTDELKSESSRAKESRRLAEKIRVKAKVEKPKSTKELARVEKLESTKELVKQLVDSKNEWEETPEAKVNPLRVDRCFEEGVLLLLERLRLHMTDAVEVLQVLKEAESTSSWRWR